MNRQKAFGQGNPELAAYAESLFTPVDALLDRSRTRSREAGLPEIQVGPMDGRHLEILSRLIQPSRAIEIGTLGGYSGICIARGMKPGGVLHTFEKSEVHARVAEETFKDAHENGHLEIEFKLHIGPALENLASVEKDGPFDLVFIDADKPGYPQYLEWAVQNLRVGGVVIGDNTFAWGEVHKTSEKSGNDLKMVGSLHEFNRALATHPRLRGTIFPTAEGLTVGVKTH